LVSLEGLPSNPDEKAKRKRVTQRLTKEVQTWLSKFHQLTKKSAELERTAPPPKPSNTGFNPANPFHNNQREEEEKVALLASERRNQFLQVENELDFNEAIIAEREQGIVEIESTMREVNEIFKDLSTIVYEQGGQIENIETFVSSAVVNTTLGVGELKQAEELQKSSNTKSWCIIGLVAVVVIVAIIVVLMIVKPWDKSSSSSSSSGSS